MIHKLEYVWLKLDSISRWIKALILIIAIQQIELNFTDAPKLINNIKYLLSRG